MTAQSAAPEPSRSGWHDLAARVAFDERPFIDGTACAPRSRATIATECPFTERQLASITDCNASDIDRAVAAARRCFADLWRDMVPERRQEYLIALANGVAVNRDTLALLDCLEMGMPIAQALGAVDEAVKCIRYHAGCLDLPRGEIVNADPDHVLAMSWYEPRGVIGVISSWNFPLLVATAALAPAIAAGNTVVVKPSPVAPSSVLLLARIATEHGLPAGVINVVPGGAETGAALAGHPDVDQLQFIGSAATGRRIMVSAGESNGKPVMLEGGGKSAQIVFEDAATIEHLGAAIASAAFANCGQICVARTRLLVHSSIAETILEQVGQATAEVFTIGDPLDMSVSLGPLASRAQRDRVRSYLEVGAEERADYRCFPAAGAMPERGYFMQPGAFAAAVSPMRIAQEEIFGPVLAVIPFETEAEAVSLANDTPYGLAATVWTRDVSRARRLSHALDAGRIDIRASDAVGAALHLLPAEPFRGSGHGVLGGIQGLRAFQRLKAVQIITD